MKKELEIKIEFNRQLNVLNKRKEAHNNDFLSISKDPVCGELAKSISTLRWVLNYYSSEPIKL